MRLNDVSGIFGRVGYPHLICVRLSARKPARKGDRAGAREANAVRLHLAAVVGEQAGKHASATTAGR